MIYDNCTDEDYNCLERQEDYNSLKKDELIDDCLMCTTQEEAQKLLDHWGQVARGYLPIKFLQDLRG